VGERTSKDIQPAVEEAQIGEGMEGSLPMTAMNFVKTSTIAKQLQQSCARKLLCEMWI
jgi:hypothetical protein